MSLVSKGTKSQLDRQERQATQAEVTEARERKKALRSKFYLAGDKGARGSGQEIKLQRELGGSFFEPDRTTGTQLRICTPPQ